MCSLPRTSYRTGLATVFLRLSMIPFLPQILAVSFLGLNGSTERLRLVVPVVVSIPHAEVLDNLDQSPDHIC